MFELPEAKRVRREDLEQSDESSWDQENRLDQDDNLQARVNAQIAQALGLDVDDEPVPYREISRQPVPSITLEPGGDGDGDRDQGGDENNGEQGYEFNLFSTASTGGTAGPGKVILEDETESLGDGAFVRPRSLSYYVAKVTAEEKEQYNYAALTADDILRWSTRRSCGMEMPWKVISTSATRKAKPGDKSADVWVENMDEAPAKRKRPGKKRRILLRQRKQASEKEAEAAGKKQMEKEEHIKNKKKRLNRIKKLRKRAKDKEKKLAAGEAHAADESDGSSDAGE